MFQVPVSSADHEQPQQTINLVQVDIVEESIPVDISFNGSFEGKLHCSATLLLNLGLIVESVDVFLDVEYPPEITVALTDYDFTLTPQNPTFEFTANVTVLPETSSTKRPEIIIDGTANAQPTGTKGGIAEDSSSVVVLPFYTAEISFKDGSGTIQKGRSGTFPLVIENRGNAAETYVLNWANKQELNGKDISVEFEEKSISINEGEKKEMDVKVETGDDTTRGSYLIRIEVWSERNGPDSKEESNAVIVVDVSDPYIGSIQGFFSRSPYMIYISAALLIILIIIGVYLLLRLRARRAWKRRLREYQLHGDYEEDQVEARIE
jgi:hypothetical protein